MATLFHQYATGERIKPARVPTSAGQMVTVGELIAVTAAQAGAANTLLGTGITVPANAEIVSVAMDCDSLDSNGSKTATIAIGDSGSDARLMAASTIAQAGGVSSGPSKGAMGYQYTSDTVIQAKIKAAAATGQAGNVRWHVTYFVN